MTTEPFTSTFGAIPRPEEPPRRPDPPPPAAQYGGFGDMAWSPDRTNYPSPQYAAFSPSGPTANASVINNIRIGGGGYRGCNHLLHGTLTLVSCGLWAPVWFLAWITARQR